MDDRSREEIMIKKIATIVFIVILGILFLINTISIVSAGHVGIITRFGAVSRVAEPGLAFKIPFAEGIKQMETRTQKEQTQASAASKDLQDVDSTIALNFHLDSVRAVDVYQNIGVEYKVRVIDPAIQEAFKATTAKFTAEELIVKREAVKQVAFIELKKRLNYQNIIVDDFNIVNFSFSPEFNKAIEEKQVAQQNVQREKQNLERIKIEAEQAKAQAEGQAQAQKALKETGSLSPEYLQFLALQKWNGILPTVTGNGVPFINIPIK